MPFDLLLLNHSTAFHTLVRSEHHATLCCETWRSLVDPCLCLSFVFGVIHLVSRCSYGAAAGLWFPELVRLMLQKLTKERLHSRAGQHVTQLSLWSIRPSLYCCDMYRTGSLSLPVFGKHHHRNISSNTAHCQRSCALSSALSSVITSPLSFSHNWSKIEICSTLRFSLFSAEQDVGRRKEGKKK